MSASENNETQTGFEKTMMSAPAGSDATLMGATVACPVCKTENAPGERYCGECGFLLTSTPGGEVAQIDSSSLARLVDAAGNREFLLKQGENTIGREGTDVLLTDPTVSRRHALLVVEGEKSRIEDLGSSNGTFVAGRKLNANESVDIASGAELKFGSLALTLTLPEIKEASETDEVSEPTEEAAAPETASVDTTDEEVAAPEVEEEVTPTEPVARLVSTTDPNVKFEIAPGTVSIGRHSSNDIVISNDQYVSGAHAELTASDAGFRVTDIGSTNGTLLNGSKLASGIGMTVTSGDEIVFGKSSFKLEII